MNTPPQLSLIISFYNKILILEKEPSIINFKGRFFLAMRNDTYGYVTSGKDGLNFDTPQILCFDDGSESGNYNTQQHWLICGGELYLVYTRKNANNDQPNLAPIHNSYDTAAVMKTEHMQKDIDFITAFASRMANAVMCPVSRDIPDNIKEKLDEYLLRKRKK